VIIVFPKHLLVLGQGRNAGQNNCSIHFAKKIAVFDGIFDETELKQSMQKKKEGP